MADLKAKFETLFMGDPPPISEQTTQTKPKPAPRKQDSARDRWARLEAIQADNIKKSEHLRAEINRMIRAGGTDRAIMFKALEAVGLMTGDMTAYNQAIQSRQGKPEDLAQYMTELQPPEYSGEW